MSQFIRHALYHTSYPNLVAGTCPVIAERQQQQQYESCSSNSTLHAFHLIVPRQQATSVKDVACQCDGVGNDNDDNSGNSDTCGCSSNDGLFPANPSLSLPVKISALRKRYVGKKTFP